ncbi:pyridoxal phosphate-dependent decarboxylase family protein [Mameliella alba]|uniref:pyridoxal phosphate-dependent decarboxylase family protein n=1 Tax=Mameliella alba TaxID=561184 RepID=UPI000B536FE5|nr:pyridoxal-dependent decarboxylase [Mameliella alba]MBY6118445.1 aspartate aminotransferase family protein [Mameliella alba]OWV43286.1 aspartate aminotransferase family protein [Mameliella alba]OWV68423.1 aspartate aminotransferase family protein [Mameliella alba]
MDWDEFAAWGAKAAEFGAEYHKGVRERPVRPAVAPGSFADRLAPVPPEAGEEMGAIWEDFERIVPEGLTHWQHPRFFAYFPANAAPVSMLAEMLVSVLAPQCMLWQTSPVATEMEGVMIDWLRQALGLPEGFSGVIQDSASSATLSAVLTMRERATGWTGNREGLSGKGQLRIYCSDQVHSSIDRACWVAGIGQENLVKLPTRGAPEFAVDAEALRVRIAEDRAAGHVPAGIIAVTGATGVGAWDHLPELVEIARDEGLYLHLDAAWAGSAMICPEFRAQFWEAVEGCDSIVFNPHKWLGAQFDCSVQFLRDPKQQIDTLKIEPEYLKTSHAEVVNYSEWTIPLGRRFRALKLWFLIRYYGLEGLRARLRNHVAWAAALCEDLRRDGFEIVTEPILSLFTFRGPGDDAAQQALVDAINADGRIYVTQGMHAGRKVIRFQVGQFDCTRDDVMMAGTVIRELAGGRS